MGPVGGGARDEIVDVLPRRCGVVTRLLNMVNITRKNMVTPGAQYLICEDLGGYVYAMLIGMRFMRSPREGSNVQPV